ncbi:MAG: hypothetical protein ACM3SY_01745 [Candidatus Omnitrophota bacterium]
MASQKRFKVFTLVMMLFLCWNHFFGQTPEDQQPVTPSQTAGNGEAVRTIIGFEQAGASSTASEQNFFLDLFVSSPFPAAFNKNMTKIGPRLRMWGNVRLTSAPQPTCSVIQLAEHFLQKVGDMNLDQIAQVVEFSAGLEYLLKTYENSKGNGEIFSLSMLAGAGLITTPEPSDPTIFNLTDDLKSKITDPNGRYKADPATLTGKQYVTFIIPQKLRFYRLYFAGLRFKVYSPVGGSTNAMYKFPAMFDLTVGLNDAIAGDLKHPVIGINGCLPLAVGNKFYIYLFGNVYLNTKRTPVEDPVFLEKVSVCPPADQIVTVKDTPLARDYYRIGVGIGICANYRNQILNGFVSGK